MALYSRLKTWVNEILTAPDLNAEFNAVQASVNSIDSSQLAANCVTTVKITDAAVTTAKFADAAVTTAKVADAAITSVKTSYYSTLVLTSQKRRISQTIIHNGAASPSNFGIVIPRAAAAAATTATLVEVSIVRDGNGALTYNIYRQRPTWTADAISGDPFATASATLLAAPATTAGQSGVRTQTFSSAALQSGDILFVQCSGTPKISVTFTYDMDY